MAKFPILEFGKLFPVVFSRPEDQIIRNNIFYIRLKRLLPCFGSRTSVRLQVCGRNVLSKMFGLEKFALIGKCYVTNDTYTPPILLRMRNACCYDKLGV